ncbi:TetR/AcrR family transcriptional regulator [Frankia tisae]|uniref:TetR/AcrR family transcriptional regulator n=1 Tax=Frankia tisae TaxID=2950104 RepID=UPI0021C06518|nr:TetR/AcrR family transcriptional regulator [Frankia tisae]
MTVWPAAIRSGTSPRPTQPGSAVEYAAEYGFAELSWRPVAAALGVSPTTLVHHFGTKEQMLEAILGRLRERMSVATRDPRPARPPS